MRRKAIALLLMALLTASLCSCGAVEPLDGPEPVSAAGETPPPAAPTGKTADVVPPPPTIPDTAETLPPPPVPESAEELCFPWSLYQTFAYQEVLWFHPAPDGSYTLCFDDVPGFWNETETETLYHYSGVWEMDEENGTKHLQLSLAETDDPLFVGAGTLGSYIWEDLSWCDGQLLMRMSPFGGERNLFTERLGDGYEYVLIRKDERETNPTQRCDAQFYAHFWKSRYGGSGDEGDYGYGSFVIFADDLELDGDGGENNAVRECVPYIVDDGEGNEENLSLLSGGPDGLLPYGSDIYLVTTNSKGMIVDAIRVPTVPPLEADTAEAILRGVGEMELPLRDGATVAYQGTDVIWGENACMFEVRWGEHPEEMIRYGVIPDGSVFRYDAGYDYWDWIDPEAVG